jgi:hypothetical protein
MQFSHSVLVVARSRNLVLLLGWFLPLLLPGAAGCLRPVLVAAWSSNLVFLLGWFLPLLLPGAAGCLRPIPG